MDMLKLGREVFDLVWKRKTLWFFGIFAGVGGLNSNANSSGSHAGSHLGGAMPIWVWPLLAVGAGVLVVFVLLHVLSESALIEGATRGRANVALTIRQGLRDGRPFFWRIAGLKLLFWLAAGVVAVIVMAPFALAGLGIAPFWVSGLIALPLALVGVPALLTLFYVYEFALRFVVLDGDSLRQAVAHAHGFLHGRLGNATRLVVVSLLGSTLCATATAVVALPALAVGGALFFLGMEQPAFAVGAALAFPAVAIGAGLVGGFFSATWTLGFLDERARTA